MGKDIRWKQRYQNFEKAFKLLEEAVLKTGLSILEKAGVIRLIVDSYYGALKQVLLTLRAEL